MVLTHRPGRADFWRCRKCKTEGLAESTEAEREALAAAPKGPDRWVTAFRAVAFLALPMNALPAAQIVGDDDLAAGAAWQVVEMLARGERPGPETIGFGEKLLLRADVDGWRAGIEIAL